MVVRGQSIDQDPHADALKLQVEIPAKSCGRQKPTDEIMTVNGAIRPRIEIAPGKRQFWRIVNASPDRYLDLQVDGQKFEIVALDGMPLAYHDPKHPTLMADHVEVSPGGRLEAIVSGPPESAHASLRTLCVDAGVAGAPNPGMVLADLVPPSSQGNSNAARQSVRIVDELPAVYKPIDVERLTQTAPDFTVTFTEDKDGFYINGAKFAADARAMTTARVGTYQHWRIVNATEELHPFHIHQVHFLVYAENGVALQHPVWLDTVDVPIGGTVDVILDFTNPVIKGMAVFHCHLLNHEDKGMMAKILFK